MSTFSKTGLFYWWVALVVIVLDQATKLLVVHNIGYQETVPLLPCLSLVHVYNTGAAFSFLARGGGWQTYLFIAIALAALAIIAVALKRTDRSRTAIGVSLAMVAGGAVGNVIDRVCYNHVIDFILFYVQGVFTYPAFNVADCGICIGAGMMVIYSLFFDRDDSRKDDSQRENGNGQ
ncbi:MAG: lipoprotein signal peptidase [Succinivibrionaceae bacterium]|nr:lipoprotein signal peptidase [Succinivibrionaceae bacterium]